MLSSFRERKLGQEVPKRDQPQMTRRQVHALSFLSLVAMPGATSSVLAPSSDARSPSFWFTVLFFYPMKNIWQWPFDPSVGFLVARHLVDTPVHGSSSGRRSKNWCPWPWKLEKSHVVGVGCFIVIPK